MYKTDRYKEEFKSCRLQKFTEDSLKITYRQLTPDTTDYRPLLKVFSFLAVQDSSIGDLVTHSLTHSVSE